MKSGIKVKLRDKGILPYKEAWDLQKKLFNQSIQNQTENYLVLTEHPPVITIGKSGGESNLLVSRDYLYSSGIELFEIDRGGDITFHGPGQIVGYPVLNLVNFNKDVHWYLRALEKTIIQTLAHFDVDAHPVEHLTGVWVGSEKICAIGVKITRWVTMHGFALNVSTDLNYFNHIVPCGIENKGVTSLREICDRDISINTVKDILIQSFAEVFDCNII